MQLDLRALRVDGQGRGGAARRGRHHGQPQHRAVRRAAADGRLGRPHRHAGGHDARLRRGGLRARSGAIIVEALVERRRPGRAGRAAPALCERRPALPGLPRLHGVRRVSVADDGVTEVDAPAGRGTSSALLRDKDTTDRRLPRLVNELTLLLTYEATKDLPTEHVEIETPLERMTTQRISGKKVAVCPVLRAGLGMLDGVLSLVSGARVGFIGLYRDEETLQPVAVLREAARRDRRARRDRARPDARHRALDGRRGRGCQGRRRARRSPGRAHRRPGGHRARARRASRRAHRTAAVDRG